MSVPTSTTTSSREGRRPRSPSRAAEAARCQLETGSGGIAALPNGLSHEVFGYLPYWVAGTSSMEHLRYDRVSTIAYFSVGAGQDGTLGKTTSTGVATPSGRAGRHRP